MNLKQYAILLLVFLVLGCDTDKTILELEITNPTTSNRLDEPVTIDIDEHFRANLSDLKNIALFDENIAIPFQFIDHDNDGKIDELNFNISLKPKVTKTITVKYLKQPISSQFEKRINIRLGKKKAPYQEVISANRVKEDADKKASDLYVMEGPAWENDKVAFRNYFDQRNSMDIFGKSTSKMILDSIGLEGMNYHKREPWGMDVLKVGSSLGAGAIALKSNDTIYRISNAAKSTYNVISEGPNKGILSLDHKNIVKGLHNYNINHKISITAGQYYYESIVNITGVQANDQLVTGLVNLHNDSMYMDKSVPGIITIYTYDKQAEDGSMLGMAILLRANDFAGIQPIDTPTDGISNNYMLAMNTSNNKNNRYRVYSCWERTDDRFKTLKGFQGFLKNEAMNMSQPLQVKKVIHQ